MSLKKIVLFDGVCNLCSGSVQFILRRDKKDQFVFGSLQGKTGQQYLARFNLPADTFNSFMLVENDILYTKSTGVLRMLKCLGGAWPLLYACILIPRFMRDAVYHWIAANRYRWFGKKNECWIPTPDLQRKFLE